MSRSFSEPLSSARNLPCKLLSQDGASERRVKSRAMDTRFGGLDLADLDAVTVADQPRAPYHTGLAGAEAACEWRQATETVTLFVPVRPGTASRILAVQIKPQRLHVAYRGTAGQLVLEAELGGR